MTRTLFALALTSLAGCGCQREPALSNPAAGVESRPHPDNPKWVAWRHGMSAFLRDARAAMIDGRGDKALAALDAIPVESEPTTDAIRMTVAGKCTAMTSNARMALEAIDAGELDRARELLDGIEGDPSFDRGRRAAT